MNTSAQRVLAQQAAITTNTSCGYCGNAMPRKWALRDGWCPCGSRRITSLGQGIVLVHGEGCAGEGCDCRDSTQGQAP